MIYNLVGGFKHDFYFPFHKKGMSSETHWLINIFQGVETTNQ